MEDGTEAVLYQAIETPPAATLRVPEQWTPESDADDSSGKRPLNAFAKDNRDRQQLKYRADAAVDTLRKQGSTDLGELRKIYDAWRAEAATHIVGIVEQITAAQTWHELRQARSCFSEMIPSFGRPQLWQFPEISSASTESANRLRRADRRDYMRRWRAKNPEKARQQNREAQRRHREFWAPIRAAGMAAFMLATLWS
jgi:hypothetical protein